MRFITSKLKALSEGRNSIPLIIGALAALLVISKTDLGIFFLAIITGLIAYTIALSFIADSRKSIIAFSSILIFICLRFSDLFPINGWITLIWFTVQLILTFCLILLDKRLLQLRHEKSLKE